MHARAASVMTRAGAATPRAMASIAPRNSATTTTTAAATATRAVAPARVARAARAARITIVATRAKKWSDEVASDPDAAAASASSPSPSPPSPSSDDDAVSMFEPGQKKKKLRKRRDGSNTRRASVDVTGIAIDAAKGVAPITVQSASEEAYILFLLGYVVVIFLGGLLLALSAFDDVLPSRVETWVENSLYPAYSPTVIGFLVFSSIYGLIKTRDDPNTK
jgi:hypothetical protein